MKKKKFVIWIIILAAILACAAVLYPRLSGNYEADSKGTATLEAAPDFTVYDTDGNKVSLSGQKGTPVIVNFWATWCGYCKEEFPSFEKMAEKYGGHVNFMMVDLTDETRETAEAAMNFIEDQGYTFPVYLDQDQSAEKAYGINSIPLTLFIDSDGNLFHTQIGAMDEETLETDILSLINGSTKKAEAPEQEAGCSFH